jgi:mRNA interferase RelE/StbE
MKTAFKDSFYKSIIKLRNRKLKSEVADIISKVETAEDLRSIPNLKKIHGRGKYYRIKIGDYRIGLKLVDEVVYFVDLAHRQDIYKHFP